ncbi:MAG: DUF4097 domain-containing protein [Kangiellaceae bacterium]|nr:DUF4097 domain-containing protein [Kangiellaceae bacterium]MCW8998672.1 DUF4097 domain-containing protein [Kangiellaceae bacterium]
MIKKRNILALSIGSLLVSGCITVHALDLNYETTENLTQSANGISSFRVDAGAGFIKLKGVEGLDEIKVRADLKVDRDHYKLTLDKRGDEAVLIAEPNTQRISFMSSSPSIDLTIEIPARLETNVKDGSGFIEIDNLMADLTVNDGSGNLSIKDIGGDLTIDDGSGSIDIASVGGKVTIDDGSGGIDIVDVKKSIEIEDGSGGIELSRIGGKVDVDDGSGDLSVVEAAGHVTIDDGSGSIRVNHLEDGLTIINSGSGGLSIKNVKGNVTLDE